MHRAAAHRLAGPWLLLTHSLKRVSTLVISMGALLAAFQVLLIAVARSIHTSNAFGELDALIPPFARELEPSLISLMSFSGIICVGYFHLAVMGSLTGLSIALATVPTFEIESGFIDLILSRPVPRHWIITRSIIAGAVCAAAVLLLMMAGTWAGLHLLAPPGVAWPSRRLILSLATNLGLLMQCWSGVAMAIGSGARRRSVAGATAGLLALAMFLLHYVANVWKPARSVAWISPFAYYDPSRMITGNSLPARDVLILSAIALAGWAAAYVIFTRRDITH